jgi:hypothetical protein
VRLMPEPGITVQEPRCEELDLDIVVQRDTIWLISGIIWGKVGAWGTMATAEPCGVPRRAAASPGSGEGRRCGSWPHGLLPGEPADEDQPPLVTVRADHRLD